MKKFIALIALAMTAPSYAQSIVGIDPVDPPPGVRADVVDRDTCIGVRNSVGNHMRNLFAVRMIANTQWYKNSQGEYLAFDCFYNPNFRYDQPRQTVGIIFVTDKATLRSISDREIADAQAELEERQRFVKQNKYF